MLEQLKWKTILKYKAYFMADHKKAVNIFDNSLKNKLILKYYLSLFNSILPF